MDKVRWGILSTAKIGIEKVIPAIKQARNCQVLAIASRSEAKANRASQKLDISKSYASYDQLLNDKDIDAIYNPLPNHLHVPKTLEALKVGKHVLCEKPIALDAIEAKKLIEATENHPELKVMEAFMYRFHPQWTKVKSMVENKEIGSLQTIASFFSYFNDNPDNIRNKPGMGGGALMDIGCYCISLSRYLFDNEPESILGCWKIDPDFGTDYLASGTMDFKSGTAIFTCSMQSDPKQWVKITGTEGSITIDIPFNAPAGTKTYITIFKDEESKRIAIKPANQYALQAEAFANAILNDGPVPTPLDDALKNMEAIDAFRKNINSGKSK